MGTYGLRVPASALGTYRRRRAACPQGPAYCTYGVRVPALGVPYVPRTVAPQARWLHWASNPNPYPNPNPNPNPNPRREPLSLLVGLAVCAAVAHALLAPYYGALRTLTLTPNP